MVIGTRNSIDVNINSEILYVGIIYIVIKYQYVNVIWFFILVSFYILYTIFRLPGAYMYLTAKNTISNFTICSSPTEREHIKSNDYLVRESGF